MPGAQVPSSVTILNSLKGFQGISFTNFATSALSQIAAGSVVEIAGAFFNFPADETINASTWTSITSGNTAYIVLVPAGTAGSQTVTAEFTATAPVWRDDNQGWYASAASVSRVIGSVYKVSATAQTNKFYYASQTNTINGKTYAQSASVASSLSVGGVASVANSLTVGSSASVTTSINIGTTATVGSSLTLGGQLNLHSLGPRSYTSGTLALGGSYTVPAGLYNGYLTGTTYLTLTDSGGTSRQMSASGEDGCVFFISDGSNAVIRNGTTAGSTWNLFQVGV
jgi:hypothetical protein